MQLLKSSTLNPWLFLFHSFLTVSSLVRSSFKIAVETDRFRLLRSSSWGTNKEKNLPASACNHFRIEPPKMMVQGGL